MLAALVLRWRAISTCGSRCRRPRAKSASPAWALRSRSCATATASRTSSPQALEDASFALGFVHAQDRLWQMEMNRRIAAGRLSEIVGAGGLETDRFLRTLGVRRAAEANLRTLDAETRKLLDAYAAGVNAFLASDPVLPPEFWLTGARPEPWTPADSVAWVKMMAWDLGGNWRSELLRMRLAKTLPLARIHELLPPYPGETAAADRRPQGALRHAGARRGAPGGAIRLPATTRASAPTTGWSPARAAKAASRCSPTIRTSGSPRRAVWYFAQLSAPGLNVIGATLPGVPGVILGRNERIAWGFTNTGPDVQDLYIEKLDAAGGYLDARGAAAVPGRRRNDQGEGRGTREAAACAISRHGPVISDVSRIAQDQAPRGHVIAFAWTALAEDDRSMQAALKFARAQRLGRLPRRGARLPVAAAEHRLRRHRGQHRLRRRRPRAAPQARPTT